LDTDSVRTAYRRWARAYDLVMGAILRPGRKEVLELMQCRAGDHILEVGVGTGLSLPLYPANVQITGIDLSTDMLERAEVRRQRYRLHHVELREMDAESMSFAEHSFDKVVAMYVASVVPHPERLVAEMQRVCKPGGDIYIVNHFLHAHPLVAGIERLLAPLSKLVGFRPDFSLEGFIERTGLDVVERRGVNLGGYWTLLKARNTQVPEAVQARTDMEPVRAVASR